MDEAAASSNDGPSPAAQAILRLLLGTRTYFHPTNAKGKHCERLGSFVLSLCETLAQRVGWTNGWASSGGVLDEELGNVWSGVARRRWPHHRCPADACEGHGPSAGATKANGDAGVGSPRACLLTRDVALIIKAVLPLLFQVRWSTQCLLFEKIFVGYNSYTGCLRQRLVNLLQLGPTALKWHCPPSRGRSRATPCGGGIGPWTIG